MERSNAERLLRGKKLKPEERLWSLRVQERIPAPLRAKADRPGSPSAGVDQGVAKPITLKDHQGRIRIYRPDPALTVGKQKRLTGLKERKTGCVRGSRRWTELGREVRAAGKRIRNIEREELRRFANEIASEYDLIGIEKLNNRGMRASARGTHEKHGKSVAGKRELNRSLDRVAPRKTNRRNEGGVRTQGGSVRTGESEEYERHVRKVPALREAEPGEPSGLPLLEVRVLHGCGRERRRECAAAR